MPVFGIQYTPRRLRSSGAPPSATCARQEKGPPYGDPPRSLRRRDPHICFTRSFSSAFFASFHWSIVPTRYPVMRRIRWNGTPFPKSRSPPVPCRPVRIPFSFPARSSRAFRRPVRRTSSLDHDPCDFCTQRIFVFWTGRGIARKKEDPSPGLPDAAPPFRAPAYVILYVRMNCRTSAPASTYRSRISAHARLSLPA